MQINIIDIGNSKGIRLPKAVLQQCEMVDKIDLIVQDDHIILTPIERKEVRKNWSEAFQKMAERQDDKLLITSVSYNDEDWQWE